MDSTKGCGVGREGPLSFSVDPDRGPIQLAWLLIEVFFYIILSH